MKRFESRCYVYHSPGDVRVETWPIECGETDIVIKIEVCGRCGTDRRIFLKGHDRVRTPAVLGHELVGRVVAVGSRVSELREGIGFLAGRELGDEQVAFDEDQRVTVQGRIAHHRDGLMLMKDPIQNLSFYIPGAYACYMKVPETFIRAGALLRIPDHVTDEEASLVEPAACALESIFATPHTVGVDPEGRHLLHGGVKKGGRMLIIGSGTLATIYAALAKIDGTGEVTFLVRSRGQAELIAGVLGSWPKYR
ncbi:MAG: alcohol dehydrogenase catalytic domain-containing protein, partial [Planctomycetia bacterium]|nr:alcohol dehydrogenase catalytic domain-containing protein [Planctomycetia bacterium]